MVAPDLNLRNGSLADIPAIRQLFLDSVSRVCSRDYDEAQIRAWAATAHDSQRWESVASRQHLVIAENGTDIVGFSSLAHGNHLDMLFVHHQYQRQGIAARLYRETEVIARQMGELSISADVSKTAFPFFISRGFTLITEQQVRRQEVILSNFKMKKDLLY